MAPVPEKPTDCRQKMKKTTDIDMKRLLYIIMCARPVALPLLLIMLFLHSAAAVAQTGVGERYRALLDSIDRHNTTLRALRQQVEADRAGERAALRLPDPEVGLAYLWGSPQGVPARRNVEVTQQLDWGVLSGRRRRVARLSGDVSQGDCQVQRREVMAEAERVITELSYYNRLCAELARRKADADDVAALCERRRDNGSVNQLDVNKMRLNASLTATQLRRAEVARGQLRQELQRLAGGRPVVWDDTLYVDHPLPPLADLRTALPATPELRAAEAAVELQRARLRLSRTEALPALSVGFAGEYLKGEGHSGVSLGLSVPLWGSGRRRTAQSRAQLVLAELQRDDRAARLDARLGQRYAEAQALRATADRLGRELAAADNAPLLRRALELERLSLLDYLLELSFCYDARMQWMEAERDARRAEAEVWLLTRE